MKGMIIFMIFDNFLWLFVYVIVYDLLIGEINGFDRSWYFVLFVCDMKREVYNIIIYFINNGFCCYNV